MNKLFTVIILSSTLLIVGCATNKAPTFADKLQAEGAARIEIAEQWEKGSKQVASGEKQIANGRDLITEGQELIREGEALLVKGNIEVQTNRQAFQTASVDVMEIKSATAAFNHVDKLKKIANKWENGEEKLAKGNKLIKRGNASIVQGEKDIQDGHALISTGRDNMQKAESRY